MGLAPAGQLAELLSSGHPGLVDEEQGIYRGEVMVMMGALADIQTYNREILAILRDEEEGDEEEEADT